MRIQGILIKAFSFLFITSNLFLSSCELFRDKYWTCTGSTNTPAGVIWESVDTCDEGEKEELESMGYECVRK